jgi:hypothetical protein
MFMGYLISAAFCSAAAMTLRASPSVTINLLSEEKDSKRLSKVGSYVSYLPDNNVESLDTACGCRYFDKCRLISSVSLPGGARHSGSNSLSPLVNSPL